MGLEREKKEGSKCEVSCLEGSSDWFNFTNWQHLSMCLISSYNAEEQS